MGDSLTRGYAASEHWPLADAYPAKLGANYPYLTVNNQGYVGYTTDEIRLRTGSLSLVVKPQGGQIPASGTVNLETAQVIGWGGSTSLTLTGVLNGVPGTISRTPSSLTFTRAAAGNAVSMAGPAPFVATGDDFSASTIVLWAGRNDVNQNIKGPHPSVAEHVVSSVLDLVEWLTPRCKSIVVLGTSNSVDEPSTTTKYETVKTINERLAQLLPHKYADIRTYLVHQAIHDVGITPTQADIDNMAADAPPPSIWDTGSHYLKPVAEHVAGFVGNHLAAKGYI